MKTPKPLTVKGYRATFKSEKKGNAIKTTIKPTLLRRLGLINEKLKIEME